MKNPPKRIPFEKFEKNFFQKSKCTHIASINLKGKVSDIKNIVTALVYFCNYPYGTPCMMTFIVYYGNFELGHLS